eukprot:2232996-Pyramimonas_sp.AAC.1
MAAGRAGALRGPDGLPSAPPIGAAPCGQARSGLSSLGGLHGPARGGAARGARGRRDAGPA